MSLMEIFKWDAGYSWYFQEPWLKTKLSFLPLWFAYFFKSFAKSINIICAIKRNYFFSTFIVRFLQDLAVQP